MQYQALRITADVEACSVKLSAEEGQAKAKFCHLHACLSEVVMMTLRPRHDSS